MERYPAPLFRWQGPREADAPLYPCPEGLVTSPPAGPDVDEAL